MRLRFFSLAVAISLGVAAMAIRSQHPVAAQAPPQNRTEATDVAQGKYLVHHVAQCVQCHTPRDTDGQMKSTRLLAGAAIPVQAPANTAPWATESASIAGLENYDRSFVIYLLTHGQRPDGSNPKHPMPRFQLTPSDAQAVVAYLESL